MCNFRCWASFVYTLQPLLEISEGALLPNCHLLARATDMERKLKVAKVQVRSIQLAYLRLFIDPNALFYPQPTTSDMDIDTGKTTSEQDAILVNGHQTESDQQSSETATNEKKTVKASEMTSADYYFDSYAHFGKISRIYSTINVQLCRLIPVVK